MRRVVDGAAALVHGAVLVAHVEVVGERAGPQGRADMHVPGQRGGAAVAADLGGAIVNRRGSRRRARPAPSGMQMAEQAGLVQVVVVLGREAGLAVVGRGAVGEAGLAQARAPARRASASSSLRRKAAGSNSGGSRATPSRPSSGMPTWAVMRCGSFSSSRKLQSGYPGSMAPCRRVDPGSALRSARDEPYGGKEIRERRVEQHPGCSMRARCPTPSRQT